MKFWCRIRELLPPQFVSPRGVNRDPLTTSAINALPVSGPPLREEIAHGHEKAGKVASTVAPAPGKACPDCGANTKVSILNYWCDPATDIITPADTVEQCDCGWTGVVVEHDRPF